tara:strand:+ start:179 stop:307 length:129 start_codon:yes stop_codon:yes gene_type:complete
MAQTISSFAGILNARGYVSANARNAASWYISFKGRANDYTNA